MNEKRRQPSLRRRAAQRLFFVLPLLLAALWIPATAGTPVTPREVGFQNISVEHGLSQSSIRCILQDSAGFLWFGTEDGLNRYDGYAFTVYRHCPGDPHSLCFDAIFDLCEGADGSIWVATAQGLDRLDRATDRFTHFRSDPDNPQSLSHDMVLTVHRDTSNRIWAGSRGGLDRYDPDGGGFTRMNHRRMIEDGLPITGVRNIHEDDDGMLLLATNNGVELFDPEQGTVRVWRADPSDPSTLSSPVTVSLCRGPEGRLWVGTNAGLNALDTATGKVTRMSPDELPGINLATQPVVALAADSHGVIWVGTLLGGLCTLDTATGIWDHYRYVPGDPSSLSLDYILSIIEDRSGLVWIGTNGSGIDIFDREKKPFIHHTHVPGNPDSIQHLVVRSIAAEPNGDLWIAMVNGGLTRVHHATGRHFRHFNDPQDQNSLGANTVWYVHVDRGGTVWAGTTGAGLARYRPQTDDFFHYRNDPDNPQSISGNLIQHIFEDTSGRLWIGTGGGRGLNLMDRTSGAFTRFRNDPNDPGSISANGIYCTAQQADGTIWVGTNGGGLNRFNEADGTFTHFRHDPDDPHSLSDDRVLFIHPVSDGSLWLGTGMGLNHFDPASGRCRHFFVMHGLPNNVVYTILEDGDGDFWISTNHGLCRFTPPDGDGDPVIRNYDMSDGLQSNEFNSQSAWQNPDGEMFFGGIDGYTSFYPGEIDENTIVPPVVLTEVVVPGLEAGSIRPLASSASVSMPYRFNNIHVQFSALSYRQPEKNRYAYLLEGEDERWNETGNRRHATYTNLAPGHYTLRVRASNNDGVWSTDEARLTITVTPPFWQRAWFLTLASLVLVATALGVYKHRVRVVRMGSELQTARETQASILPQSPPETPGYDIDGTCIPANTVGGDFYDFIWLDEEQTLLGIALADVSGKSMDAALTAVLTTGVVQAEARISRSPAEVVAAANLPVYNKTARNAFTALCFARLDLAARTLTFTNAGLMEPLLKDVNGDVRPLKSVGSKLPLGVLPDGQYKERTIQLQPGEFLLLLTDGIPESQNRSMDFYGDNTLRCLLADMDTASMNAAAVLDAVLDEVRRFTDGAPQQDDITAVAIKVLD